jgi:hypothetical protein
MNHKYMYYNNKNKVHLIFYINIYKYVIHQDPISAPSHAT